MSNIDLSCFSEAQQQFLVCVTIHKAKNLSVLNADTFVVISFDQMHKKTSVYQNSDCPYFNEYFVFETISSLNDLLRESIAIRVVQRRILCKRNPVIGELVIDLRSIWEAPNHAFFKKWGCLEKQTKKSAGYIQLDVSIVSKYEPPAPVALEMDDYDVIENHLLLAESQNRATQRTRYVIKIHSGEFDLKHEFLIQINFGGHFARTTPVKLPVHSWNEYFVFDGYFPSLCQTIVFHVMEQECCYWVSIGSCEASFVEMSFNRESREFIQFPTLGPIYLHFYYKSAPFQYIGQILVSIESEAAYGKVMQTLTPSPMPPLNVDNYWSTSTFLINFVFLEMNFMPIRAEKLKIILSCGGTTSNEQTLSTTHYPDFNWKYVKFNSNSRPLFRLSIQLPDIRFKYEIQKYVKLMIRDMVNGLTENRKVCIKYADNLEMQSRVLEKFIQDIIVKVESIVKDNVKYRTFKLVTRWDENYVDYVRKEMLTIIETLKQLRTDMKKESNKEFLLHTIHEKIKSLTNQLKKLRKITFIRNQYPSLLVKVLIDNGHKMIGQLNLSDFMYSQTETSKGLFCGIRSEILLKNTQCLHTCKDCGCIGSQLSFLSWVCTRDETSEYTPPVIEAVQESSVLIQSERYFACKIFVHQGKIKYGNEKSGLCDPKLVLCVGDVKVETETVKNSLSPVWNETLVINDLKLPGVTLDGQPPAIMLVLYDENRTSNSDKRLGIGSVTPRIQFLSEDDVQVLFTREDVPDTEEDALIESNHPRKSLRESIAHVFNRRHMNKSDGVILDWIDLHREGRVTASVLIATELIEIHQRSGQTATVDYIVGIPKEIAPEMVQLKFISSCIGIRQLKHVPMFTEGRFKIELSIGELIISCGVSGKRFGDGYNFLDGITCGYVNLPSQTQYWPPLVIKHLEMRGPHVIGAVTVQNLEKYIKEEITKEMKVHMVATRFKEEIEETDVETGHLLAGETVKNDGIIKRISKIFKNAEERDVNPIHRVESRKKEMKEYNWWTKYYNSLNDAQDDDDAKHRLVIYPSELELQPEFNGFQDWAETFPLFQGIDVSDKHPNEGLTYCNLKASFEFQKLEGKEHFLTGTRKSLVEPYSKFHKLSKVPHEREIIVRVYIVHALNLRSKDRTGTSDPYIRIDLGTTRINDRTNYVMNQTSPVFGRRFQLPASLPKDHILRISIYDRDELTFDDLIGTTEIDIEDRWYTKHHARCGISQEYSRLGYNLWRSKYQPSELLSNICKDLGLEDPIYYSNKVQIAGVTFEDTTRIAKDEELKERLALSALKDFDQIPQIGYKLVPEHVETRSLYRKDRPGIEQGKLQMWVELHETQDIPTAIDITPEPAKKFELRVIVWNTADVILNERNVFGKNMSDIYVKCWLDDINLAQYTDIHYRSITGEGSFNWRMIFPIKYNTGEDMMIITRKKSFYEKFDTELKVPPSLKVQIWDNDSFSPDDFLGTLSLNLSNCPIPSTTAKKCRLKKKLKRMNVFSVERVRGWFPVYGNDEKCSKTGAIVQTGKIELELEILSEMDALTNPVGLGRDPPNPLPLPNRPEDSFNWIRHPWKSFRLILVPEMKKCCLILSVLLLIFLIITSVVLGVMHFNV